MKYSRYAARNYRQKRYVYTTVVALVAVMVTGGAWLLLHRQRSPFPVAVARAVSFVVYLPDKSWHSDSARATYTNDTLFFAAVSGGTTLSLNEQATPQVFTDVPQYYPTLLTRLKQYSSFGTANGTVYLTRPAELKGGQTAALNNNGTLVFVRPNHDLSTDEWRRFFNALQVLK